MKYLELFLCGSEERWRESESPRLGESKELKSFEFPRPNLHIAIMYEAKSVGAAVKK